MTDHEKYPEMFEEDHQLDPRARKRTVPMKVMNLSMIRTGTNCKLFLFNRLVTSEIPLIL